MNPRHLGAFRGSLPAVVLALSGLLLPEALPAQQLSGGPGGGRLSLSIHWLGGRSPAGDRLADALRAQNFDDTRRSLVSGEPREHPVPDGAGFTGLLEARFRIRPGWSAGLGYLAGVDLGSAAGYRSPEFSVETGVRVTAVDLTLALQGGPFRLAAGPAYHRVETRLLSGTARRDRTTSLGWVAEGGLSLPLVRGRLYTDGLIRYGRAGEAEVLPGQVRATLGSATVPFGGATVPVRYWMAGFGVRLVLGWYSRDR